MKAQMVREQEAQTSQIGELILAKMNEQGKSIRDMAATLEITYEHMRRIVHGGSLPSKWVLKGITTNLGIDYTEAENLATRDKIQKRYGNSVDVVVGGAGKTQHPELAPLERAWGTLTEDQKATLLDMAKTMARRNSGR